MFCVRSVRANPTRKDSLARALLGKAFEHEADHCEPYEFSVGSCVAFEIARQIAISADYRRRPHADFTADSARRADAARQRRRSRPNRPFKGASPYAANPQTIPNSTPRG